MRNELWRMNEEWVVKALGLVIYDIQKSFSSSNFGWRKRESFSMFFFYKYVIFLVNISIVVKMWEIHMWEKLKYGFHESRYFFWIMKQFSCGTAMHHRTICKYISIVYIRCKYVSAYCEEKIVTGGHYEEIMTTRKKYYISILWYNII